MARNYLPFRMGRALEDFAEQIGGPSRVGAHESAEALWQAAAGRGVRARDFPHTEAELEDHRWTNLGYGTGLQGAKPQIFPSHQASVAYAQQSLPAAAARLGVPEVGFRTVPTPSGGQRVVSRTRGMTGPLGLPVTTTEGGYNTHLHPEVFSRPRVGPSGADFKGYDLQADVDPNRLQTVVDRAGNARVVGLGAAMRHNGYPTAPDLLVDRTKLRPLPGGGAHQVRHPFYMAPLARRSPME